MDDVRSMDLVLRVCRFIFFSRSCVIFLLLEEKFSSTKEFSIFSRKAKRNILPQRKIIVRRTLCVISFRSDVILLDEGINSHSSHLVLDRLLEVTYRVR